MPQRFLAALLLTLALGATAAFVLAGTLAAPQQRTISPPETTLALEPVHIPSANGHAVAGWFVQGESGRPGILLLHSLRSNRLEMLGRAAFLNAAGYSVLLIDMQAHGETPGEHITFGYRESFDAHAALRYLKSRIAGAKSGVIGVSLGGAAALLGDAPVDADAVILEAVYSTVGTAIENRLAIRLGELGRLLSPLLEWQIAPRLGVAAASLAPLTAIKRLISPVLIIAGDEDRHTVREESAALFEAAREPKALWLIEGARHQNLHRYAGTTYERRVLAFFARYLDGDGTS